MNLFRIATFIEELEPGEQCNIVCTAPGAVDITVVRPDGSTNTSYMVVRPGSIVAGPR